MIKAILIGAGSRLAIATLILAAIWGPSLTLGHGPVMLAVLIDDSASLTRAQIDRAWRTLTPHLRSLPTGSRVGLIRFAQEPIAELTDQDSEALTKSGTLDRSAPLRAQPLVEMATDLGAALDQARWLAFPRSGGDGSTLLIISDGLATAPETSQALRHAVELGPVYWWHLATPSEASDAWIEWLDAPERTHIGSPASIETWLAAMAQCTATLVISLDGKPVLSSQLTLPGNGQTIRYKQAVPLPEPGYHEVTVHLLSDDAEPRNNRQARLVEVIGPPSLLLVSRSPNASPLASGLMAGGWALQSLVPAEVEGATLSRSDLVILDGLAAHDLSLVVWQQLEQAVTKHGTGLLVLGGPDTFGSGGYRGAPLERLLPVISEPARQLPPAAVLFAIDKSGSMAQSDALGASRLALAREAVRRASETLLASDRWGLLLFDVTAHEQLSLARHGDSAVTKVEDRTGSASGGTRLTPAIELALALFAKESQSEPAKAAAPEQRLLVLITDGQINDAAAAQHLGEQLAMAGIEPIVITVGDEASPRPLDVLARAAGGRLLPATDRLQLPVLVSGAIQHRRLPVEVGPVRPLAEADLPFMALSPRDWPPLSAYQITRARAGAQVLLAAPNADPLLAVHWAGLGRVVAMPGGLSEWAKDWPTWPHWGDFIGGLLDWMAGSRGINPSGAEPSILALTHSPGTIRLTADLHDAQGHWSAADRLLVKARDPAGRWRTYRLSPKAPGHFAHTLSAPMKGRYDLILETRALSWRQAVWHEPLDELLPPGPIGHASAAALATLPQWSPALGDLPLPPARLELRPLLTAAALLGFCILMIIEQWPPRRRPP